MTFIPPIRNDLDTTSIGLTVSDHVAMADKHKVMDEMLRYRNRDGIVQVYFDHSRPRIGKFFICVGFLFFYNPCSFIDPVVCINVLTLFYEHGRGYELPGTLDWVEQVLMNRAYIAGTYYYTSAHLFLFFLSRLLQNSPEVRQRLGGVFRDRVMERFGAEADSLSLAARIISATVVDLVDDRDLETLLCMQREDGSWGDSWFYRYGTSGILVRNDGVTTALALQAIQRVRRLRSMQRNTPTEPSPLLSSVYNRLVSFVSFNIPIIKRAL